MSGTVSNCMPLSTEWTTPGDVDLAVDVTCQILDVTNPPSAGFWTSPLVTYVTNLPGPGAECFPLLQIAILS